MELPLAAIERIMRNAGADGLTEDAAKALRGSAQDIVEEMARDAVTIAREDGRDEVTVDDIRRAIEY